MNPLRYLRPAVYSALTSPAVVLNGAAVPVFAYGQPAPGVPAYVLLPPAQDTVSLTSSGRGGCQSWDCTLLVDAVTLHQNGALSVALADTLADAVSERLDRVRLPLPAGLQVQRAVVEAVNGGEDLDGERVDLHRYVRLRYSLVSDSAYLGTTPTMAPTPATVDLTVLDELASALIVGGRLVAQLGGMALPYDAANRLHVGALLGIALNTANPGQYVRVRLSGLATVVGLGLSADVDYFAGPAGVLVRDPAGLAFAHIIGRATGPDQLLYDPQDIFIL